MKIQSLLLTVVIAASITTSSFASTAGRKPTPCLNQLKTLSQDGIVVGTAGLIAGSMAVFIFAPAGIFTVAVVAAPLLGGGESALVRGIKKAKVARLIEQAYEGEGKTLTRFYNKYVKVAEKKNAEIAEKSNDTSDLHDIITIEDFAAAVKKSNEDGSICKPVEINTMNHAPSKKELANRILTLN